MISTLLATGYYLLVGTTWEKDIKLKLKSQIFLEHLCQYYSKNLIYINSFNPHKNPMRQLLLLTPSCTWWNRETERLNKWSKLSKEANAVRIWSWVIWLQTFFTNALNHLSNKLGNYFVKHISSIENMREIIMFKCIKSTT